MDTIPDMPKPNLMNKKKIKRLFFVELKPGIHFDLQ